MKKDDGLPEVAQKLQKRKPVVFVMIGIVLVACLSMFLSSKTKPKEAQPIDEIYTLQTKTLTNNQQNPIVLTPQAQVTSPEETLSNQQRQERAQEQVAYIRAKQKELSERLSAPLMLVNNTQSNKASDAPLPATSVSGDRNTQFMSQVSSQGSETATASTIGPLNLIIAEGSLIHAILEPATNSDLPGYVRAIVSVPSYSEDGSQILIPGGSRLIGQYKSGMLQGQSRIFMVWTRLITPSGISVQLGSAGVDNLGVSGMGADEVDRHFWQRFGNGSLLSILGAGAANIGVAGSDQDNSASAYRSAVANNLSQSAGESLQQDSKIPPTLTTYQGKPIIVFVARDLSFQTALNQVKPKLKIF